MQETQVRLKTQIVPLTSPVSILMPVCNEVDVIEEVINEWNRDVISKLPLGSELILDDCSNDGTEKLLVDLSKKHSFLKVNFSQRDGFFKSAIRLYKLASCPLVFFTDSDGQYIPEEFWKIAQFYENFDMVHGGKIDRKDPFYRIKCSSVYNWLVRLFFRSKCEDVNSAFRLIHRRMLDTVLDKIVHLKMLPNSEMYIRAEWASFKIKNVAVNHRTRKYGKSRSLPWMGFPKECYRAFVGLRKLRSELIRDRLNKKK